MYHLNTSNLDLRINFAKQALCHGSPGCTPRMTLNFMHLLVLLSWTKPWPRNQVCVPRRSFFARGALHRVFCALAGKIRYLKFSATNHAPFLCLTFCASFLPFANRFQDGSVLLAKYLEHQAVGIRRELGRQQPCGETHPLPPAHETVCSNGSIDETTDKARGSNRPPVVRILELGCGTGLAGLAAAFSFGRRENVDAHGESRAALPPFSHQTQPCESEEDGVRTRNSSHAVVDGGAEVVLTDLEYALANARENINRNASSLKAVDGAVKAMELDWCRPLAEEFAGELVTTMLRQCNGMANKGVLLPHIEIWSSFLGSLHHVFGEITAMVPQKYY